MMLGGSPSSSWLSSFFRMKLSFFSCSRPPAAAAEAAAPPSPDDSPSSLDVLWGFSGGLVPGPGVGDWRKESSGDLMAALPLPGLARDTVDLAELGRGAAAAAEVGAEEEEEWGERSPSVVFWVSSWHSLPGRWAERMSGFGPPGLAS